MHTIAIHLLAAIFMLTGIIWLRRSPFRSFTSFEEECQKLKPAGAGEIEEVLARNGYADERAAVAATAWSTIGGIAGLRLMEKNSRVVVRIVGLAAIDRYPHIDNQDVDYLRNKALAIRRELMLVYVEAILAPMFKAPRLHALQAAQLYSEIALRVQTLAEIINSNELYLVGDSL